MPSILPILKIPTHDKALRTRSADLELSKLQDPDFQAFLDDMLHTMYDDDGIGLAAPQVDEQLRVFTVGKAAVEEFELISGNLKKGQDMVFINPVLNKINKKTIWQTEGCLSVPGKLGKVKRNKSMHLKAFDRHGEPLVCIAHGYLAWVIQHENDHLDGVLFIDRAKKIWDA